MVIHGLITIDTEIANDTPVFTGTHVPIQSLFDCMAAGESLDQYLKDFPGVKREQALKLLELAGKELNSIYRVRARMHRSQMTKSERSTNLISFPSQTTSYLTSGNS